MASEGYNGWANKATWQVQLWIYNTEGAAEAAEEAIASAGTEHEKAEALRQHVEEVWLGEILSQASLASDMLRSVLAEVDWAEIVTALEEE